MVILYVYISYVIPLWSKTYPCSAHFLNDEKNICQFGVISCFKSFSSTNKLL